MALKKCSDALSRGKHRMTYELAKEIVASMNTHVT